jgi:hypothetical protein
MSLASYTICEEIQPRRLDASWIFRRPKLQNGARRDPRKWYEEKEDDTADFNIGTTHTHTNTTCTASTASGRSFSLRFVSEAEGIQLPGRAIHHSI